MNNTITFYIARHGKTLMNTLDRVQGWCDSPLTKDGIEVASYLGAGLRDIHFESVYSSSLRRTRQTAEVVLRAQGQTNLPITEVDGFKEACFGSYESGSNMRLWKDVALYLHYTKLEDMYEDVAEKKISSEEVLNAVCELDYMGIAENFNQVEARTQAALLDVARKESQKGRDMNMLIVAHGMSITGMLLNLGGRELLSGRVENASVCKVIYRDGKFTVESMADLSYVEKGQELKNR